MKKVVFYFLLFCTFSITLNAQDQLKTTVDGIVTRMYSELSSEQLDTMDFDFVYNYLTKEERIVLSTQYWIFEVNTPVTVSLMRDTQQKTVPFWIEESGFKKTNMTVQNASTTYEVWQKDFKTGKVELGINGLDRNRNAYFISVAAKNQKTNLQIKPVYPANQHLSIMDVGAFVYHDWDELIFDEVPESLRGQTLFTTIRGRSREAHLVKAFRKTEFPSSESPDQVLLTWSDDPKTSVDIQWRSSTSIQTGTVKYWVKGAKDTLEAMADKQLMEDRLLMNDRYIHHYTASLKNLKPGQTYSYQVINDGKYVSEIFEFKTDATESMPFSFFWTGDIHIADRWGSMMKNAYQKHPETDFFITSGDLVNTGLFRNEWDKLFDLPGDVFSHIPFMAAPGNHDSQEGLGAWMMQDFYSYPTDNPNEQTRELSYAFEYQNALFLMLDPTQDIYEQSEWIKNKLSGSQARWKMVTFHFAPYNVMENYDDIIAEWHPIFEEYGVDLVFTGHWHYYMRSYPMKNSRVVQNPSDGIIYLISIGSFGKNKEKADDLDNRPAYAARQYSADFLYQHISIDKNKLVYKSYDEAGNESDYFEIEK